MYEAKTFKISGLKGISEQTIEQHLGLYQGYVNNLNKILKLLEEGNTDEYALAEARRRLSFEFNGMRNHEYYFDSLSGEAKAIDEDSDLYQALADNFGSYDKWLESFKDLAATRGVGWAILGYDQAAKKLINYWVDEQHLGHLIGVQPIVALDMWEHSFYKDYAPSEKGKYVEAFFENMDWSKSENWFKQARG